MKIKECLILIATLTIAACGKTNSQSYDTNLESGSNLTSSQTIEFAPPVNVACLDRFEGADGLRLTGKDVYYKGYQDIQICRYPFTDQFFEKITSAAFVSAYSASDTGLFVEHNGYVYFHPKVPFGSEQPLSEPVGASEHSWDPEAPFNLASSQSGLASLTIGYSATFYKREPASSGSMFQWKSFQNGYSPRDRDKIRMAGTGLYTQNKFKSKITWSQIGGTNSTELSCPSFCEDVSTAEDGIYALSKGGIYFFDSNGNRSTIVEPTASQWKNIYGMFGSTYGVYVYYLRNDDKYVLSFITRESREVLISEGSKYLDAVIANDNGAFVLNKRALGPWQYYEMRGH